MSDSDLNDADFTALADDLSVLTGLEITPKMVHKVFRVRSSSEQIPFGATGRVINDLLAARDLP